MPSSETLERFIARVVRNAHVEAIEEFYTIDASMQENHLPPRVGRDTLAAQETFFYDPAQFVPKPIGA